MDKKVFVKWWDVQQNEGRLWKGEKVLLFYYIFNQENIAIFQNHVSAR